MRPPVGRAFAIGALVVLHSTWGHAQPSWADKATATQLLEDAEKLKAAGNLAAACPKYDESHRRSPDLDTLLKLADCYEKLGKTASAWAAFKEAIEIASHKRTAGASDPREDGARSRAAALEPKLSRLTLTVLGADTPGLEIRQDSALVGRGVWGSAVPVDPGSYQVTAKAPGKMTFFQAVEVGSNGAKVEVTVPALVNQQVALAPVPPLAAAGPSGPVPFDASRSPAQAAGSTWSSQRTIGFVVGGIGVAAAGVGAVFGLMSNSKVSERDAICPSGVHCTPEEGFRITDLTIQARADAARFQIGLAIGATAILGGVALILTAPRRVDGATALRIAPWVGTTSAGATLGGAW